MSTSSNITLRLGINGGTDLPLTYEQLDNSFLELKNVIDDYNAHINSENPHDAIFIYYDNSSSTLISSNIKDALDEIDDNTVNIQSQMTGKLDITSFNDHIESTTAHDAVDISYDKSNSTIQQDNVNAAIDQLDLNSINTQNETTIKLNDINDSLDQLDLVKLDAIDYNANDILSKVKTVDGAGSGLDADTVDGSQASELRARSTHTGTQPASTVTGLHAVAKSGDYNDLKNKPEIWKEITQADYDDLVTYENVLYIIVG